MEIRQPQLPVECRLCKMIAGVESHDSESQSSPHAESSVSMFASMSDSYDHIILSLPGLPRERFAKVAQSCGANTSPVARPLAVGIARRTEKHVPRRGPDEGRPQTKRRNLCCPKSDVESQKRAEAWELNWRSPDDASGISTCRRWCEWLRENTGRISQWTR